MTSHNPVAESINPKILLEKVSESIIENMEVRPGIGASDMDSKKLAARISDEMSNLIVSNIEMGIDDASKRYVFFSSLILAADRVAKDYIPENSKRVALLRKALCSLIEARIHEYIKDRFDIDYMKPQQAFDKINKNFIGLGKKYLGDAFHYDTQKVTGDEILFTISKCFFMNYFRKNNALELVPVFCGVDMVWADELNKEEYNVKFDRPTVMSEGADICRFHFMKK